MTMKIERPLDDYDVDAWTAFYAANPHLMRSVGAAGDDGGEESGEEGTDGQEGDGQEEAADAASDESPDEGDNAEGDEGVADKPWYDGVPDDLKKTAERFASKEDALRAILSMRKRESQIRVPGKDASDEERTAYRKAIGVPEAADKYELPDIPEAFQSDTADTERQGWMAFFHENEVPADLAKTLVARFYEGEQAKLQGLQEADADYAKEQMAALDKEWGNEAAKNKTLAKRGFDAIADRAGVSPDEMNQIETKSGTFLMDDARLLRIFAVIGREMGEAGLGGVTSDGERDTLNAQIEQVQKEIDTAQANGQDRKANELYQKKLKLTEQREGSGLIVGAGARAA